MLRRIWRSTSGLVAIVTLTFALATVGIGAVAYEVTHEALEQQLDHRIAAETSALLAEAHEDGLAGLAEAIRRRDAARSIASLDYLLVDEAGRHVAGTMVSRLPAPGYEEFLQYRDRQDGRSGVAQALTTQVGGGRLVVAADRAGLNEIDRTLMTLFSGALAAMLVAGVVVAMLIGWITRRRLSRIDATAQAIIGGDLARRIPRDGSDSEFDRLARTLNQMLDRISSLMDNLRQLSSDVAHDLRTPLTRLSNRLDQALTVADPSERDGQIRAARAEAEDLLELFAALLRIAEVEGMAERLHKAPVDLTILVEQMAETYRPDMEEDARAFLVSTEPDIAVAGDRRLLSQAIANLLDNCLRHTPRGTTVEMTLSGAGPYVHLTVSDQGPGVEAQDERRLFQRFARGERSRTEPGHGLGLAMVAAVAAAHGGSVALVEARPFTIRIALPRLV